ncbi:MAG: diadenylate cyclase [Myxococcota bacterium]
MIEYLWEYLTDSWAQFALDFDPFRDSIDIMLVTAGVYWLLLLIRGTRAVQILVGLIVLMAASLASKSLELVAVGIVLDNFLNNAPLIMVVLFQHDIRRALARVGRGFFPAVSAQKESQIVEEVVRAAQILGRRKVGALMVLERETALSDQVEIGTRIDSAVTKDLLESIFAPSSPLHDGAALIIDGRIAAVGCILPLTLKADLPEGVGTRHRAAVGITEETDAVVIVVSEETGTISIVMAGEMLRGLDAPHLRVALREILGNERRELPTSEEIARPLEVAETGEISIESSNKKR